MVTLLLGVDVRVGLAAPLLVVSTSLVEEGVGDAVGVGVAVREADLVGCSAACVTLRSASVASAIARRVREGRHMVQRGYPTNGFRFRRFQGMVGSLGILSGLPTPVLSPARLRSAVMCPVNEVESTKCIALGRETGEGR